MNAYMVIFLLTMPALPSVLKDNTKIHQLSTVRNAHTTANHVISMDYAWNVVKMLTSDNSIKHRHAVFLSKGISITKPPSVLSVLKGVRNV